jgi:hypothetical protein
MVIEMTNDDCRMKNEGILSILYSNKSARILIASLDPQNNEKDGAKRLPN